MFANDLLEITGENKLYLKLLFGGKINLHFFKKRILEIKNIAGIFTSNSLTRNNPNSFAYCEILLNFELKKLDELLNYPHHDNTDQNFVSWLDNLKIFRQYLVQAIQDCQNKLWNWLDMDFKV